MQKINSVASAIGSTHSTQKHSPTASHGVTHSAGLRSNHASVQPSVQVQRSSIQNAGPRSSQSYRSSPITAAAVAAAKNPSPVVATTPAAIPTSAPLSAPPTENRDELARIFNTVLVSSQSKGKRDFSGELSELAESPAFKSILSAVRQLSRIHGMTERQASEQIIQTFRKMDQIWGEYVFREGLEKLKSSK